MLGKIVITALAVAFFVSAGMAWQDYLHRAHLINNARRTVLEVPIQLEQGFSTEQSFTVDAATIYQVKLDDSKNVSLPIDEILTNESTIEFAITNDSGATVCQETLAFAKINLSFKAIPSKHYHISLKIIRSSAASAGKGFVLKIYMSQRGLENLFAGASLVEFKAVGLVLCGLLCLAALIFKAKSKSLDAADQYSR